MEREEKIRFIEALNTYYKLKKGYDSSFMTEKQKIIKKKDIGWKEKRRMFYQLRPKCINCKRPVGSIFKTVYNNGERYLSAKCGDIQEPCKLKIQINQWTYTRKVLPQSDYTIITIDESNLLLFQQKNIGLYLHTIIF